MTGSKANCPSQNEIQGFRKDQKLDYLAERYNVAQFASFAPSLGEPTQQFCRLADLPPNVAFGSPAEAIAALFARSSERTINIRSFSEEQSQSREFLYGIRTIDEALSALRRIAAEGAYSIANETINVSDGGVSGVAMGGLVEFRPDATPRGVEGPGFASLPLDWATGVFRAVYGFDASLSDSLNARLEFSLHPKRRGWRQSHVILWEYGPIGEGDQTTAVSWPNDFSRLIGDKVYGLIIANVLGLSVPRTTVIGRRVAPFTFGADTGSFEQWIRTSPIVQVPGKFTTAKGWRDPFALVQAEDPDGQSLASVLAQQAVPAIFSGAAIEASDGELIIEGTKGSGEEFMLGTAAPQPLPTPVLAAVRECHSALHARLGSVRFEWAFDGQRAWILQLHTGASQSSGSVIVPGDAATWVIFEIANGLEALRQLVVSLPPDTGINLNGVVGRTSHIADVVRKANIPTRIMDAQDA